MTKEELKKMEAVAEKIRKIVGKFPPPDPLPPTEDKERRENQYKQIKKIGKLYRAKMLSDKK